MNPFAPPVAVPGSTVLPWLVAWRGFVQSAAPCSIVAALDILAALTPDGNCSLIEEISLHAAQLSLEKPWERLRARFTAEIWSLLPTLDISGATVPASISARFQPFAPSQRRALFLIAFLEALIALLPDEEPAQSRCLANRLAGATLLATAQPWHPNEPLWLLLAPNVLLPSTGEGDSPARPEVFSLS